MPPLPSLRLKTFAWISLLLFQAGATAAQASDTLLYYLKIDRRKSDGTHFLTGYRPDLKEVVRLPLSNAWLEESYLGRPLDNLILLTGLAETNQVPITVGLNGDSTVWSVNIRPDLAHFNFRGLDSIQIHRVTINELRMVDVWTCASGACSMLMGNSDLKNTVIPILKQELPLTCKGTTRP